MIAANSLPELRATTKADGGFLLKVDGVDLSRLPLTQVNRVSTPLI
jgi:hypothetical protein